MITPLLEQKILKGDAQYHVHNIGASVSILNVGEGQTTVIDKIIFNPHINTQYVLNDGNIEILLANIQLNASIYTLRITSQNVTKTITFKNKFNFSMVNTTSPARNYLVATSQMQFEIDVLFVFTGKEITFELCQIANQRALNVPTFSAVPEQLPSNPIGFNPNFLTTLTSPTANYCPLGLKYGGINPGTAFDNFQVPCVGTGVAGNIVNDTLTPTATVPVLNIGYTQLPSIPQ
jgi:hypothetical protein